MEVADQWRRQWAGTAEYGKVTEGGVTRRIARAMEVLHASAPGARVRVMRAAYHSSAGPGAPASSYLMQSSRRVISSGYNLSEPLSLPSKPLEVSSMPLESSPDVDNEKLNYKVTEPDDIEISEPSKWRNATKDSVRMPSEESSSADNASIIDLDSRNSSRNTFTRSFRSSESKEDNIKNIHVRNNRVSPLLDAPVTLSTLKYTSLLNGSEEWNNRRKSYSFEDTATLNNKGFRNTDTSVMDSSTDSGICKSTEIVSDHTSHYLDGKSKRISREKLSDLPEESFQDWLYKNRPTTTFKSGHLSPMKDDHDSYEAKRDNSMISLQSKGKVTITLPITVEKDEPKQSSHTIHADDNERKIKKVGFCKTELHFAAESGTVNIIATDEKPPPSTDFRKKKSVFVPFTTKIDKSITLFGEKSNFSELNMGTVMDKNEISDQDENTAATKGILKNRIPKPKPYLLGENMALGVSNETNVSAFPTAVTLINRQMDIEKRQNNFYTNKVMDDDRYHVIDTDIRTLSAGPEKGVQSMHNKNYAEKENPILSLHKEQSTETILNKSKPLTPTFGKLKTRQLRDSDLTYFGIDHEKHTDEIQTLDNLQEEILHSVKLVQKISNSVCNSEAESDDSHEYQNISSIQYRPVPTPRPRTKYTEAVESKRNATFLKPISEGEDTQINRRSRLKTTHTQSTFSSRSISEPPKKESQDLSRKVRESSPKRSVIRREPSIKVDKHKRQRDEHTIASMKPIESLYVNVNPKKDSTHKGVMQKKPADTIHSSIKTKVNSNNPIISTKHNENNENLKNKQTRNDYRKPKRTEKLTTPDLSNPRYEDNSSETVKTKSVTHSSRKLYNQSPVDTEKIKKDKEKKVDLLNKDSIPSEVTKAAINSLQKGTIRSNNSKSSTTVTSKTPKMNSNSTIRNQSPVKSKESDGKVRSSSKSRKSKYVINYDDKNGTVSSICKIKSNQDSLRRKEVPLQNRNPTLENKTKVKIANKSGFRK